MSTVVKDDTEHLLKFGLIQEHEPNNKAEETDPNP